jgi:hypothetical protein
VQNKNTTRVTVTAQVHTYPQAIANNPGASSANKIARGAQPQTRSQELVEQKMNSFSFLAIFFSNIISHPCPR